MDNQDQEADANPEWQLLAVALAEGRTHAQAGDMCGISAKTVQRRLRDPEFARLVADLRTQRVESLTGRLLGLTDDAIAVFVGAMDAYEPQIRLQAARALLDYAHRFHRQEVTTRAILDRMATIEAAIEKNSRPREWRQEPAAATADSEAEDQ